MASVSLPASTTSPGRRISYISDPGAVTAGATLRDQKREIERYALKINLPLDGCVVDSGTAPTPEGIAAGLHAVLCAARLGEVDAVLVQHVGRLAADYVVALRIAAALSVWGVDVHEARGGALGLEPDLAARLAGDIARPLVSRAGVARQAARRPCRAMERLR